LRDFGPNQSAVESAYDSVIGRRLALARKSVAPMAETGVTRFIARAARAVGLRGEVGVLLTTATEMRRMNRRFRRKDAATDVLSFPPASDLESASAGDIAICVEIAARNARSLGHSTANEIKILALHGLLHLAGHDHERDGGQMARKEQLLRRSLGLPVGLIERDDRNMGAKHKSSISLVLNRNKGPKTHTSRLRKRSQPPR